MKKNGKWQLKLAALSCAAAFASAASATYVITDLGDEGWFYNGGGVGLRGNSLQYRLSLNNKNEVVGTGASTAHYWANGQHYKLTGYGNGTNASVSITANDINDSSVIVGRCVGSGCAVSSSNAIIRNGPMGTWSAIPGSGLTGVNASDSAFGINASGGVVGMATGNSGQIFPYSLSPAQYVGNVPGEAWAVNDNGAVITNSGASATLHSSIFAFGTPLHSANPNYTGTGADQRYAADINNQSLVVGSSLVDASGFQTWHATAWDANGNAIDIGATAGNYNSYASAVNDLGVAVGQIYVPGSPEDTFAAVFQNGQVINLGSLVGLAAAGWSQLYSATDINEAGSIVGFGLKDGAVHAYLLTVAAVIDPDPNNVPLPAPVAMLAFGLLALPRALRKA